MGFTDIFKKMFPFISVAATTVGGPLGSMAASALGKAIGADVKPGDLAAKIQELSMSEEGRLKLETAENDFKLAMAKLGYEDAEALAKIAAEDRASAREREKVVKDRMPTILGLSAVVTLLACIALLAFRDLPLTGRDAILILLGAVVASYKDVYGYFFGSSAGSAAKTTIMAAQAQNGSGPH